MSTSRMKPTPREGRLNFVKVPLHTRSQSVRLIRRVVQAKPAPRVPELPFARGRWRGAIGLDVTARVAVCEGLRDGGGSASREGGAAMFHVFFGDNAPWFTGPALLGTAFLLLRFLLLSMGGGADVDDGQDVGLDHHAHGTDGLKLFSVQTVIAFGMGFGWAGLIGYRGLEWGIPASIGIGAVGGFFMMWLMAFLLRAAMELQSSGNVNVQSAIGLEGTVYVTVPASGKGTGQITMVIGDQQRTYNAVSADEELPRNARVRVLSVNGDNSVTVVKV